VDNNINNNQELQLINTTNQLQNSFWRSCMWNCPGATRLWTKGSYCTLYTIGSLPL